MRRTEGRSLQAMPAACMDLYSEVLPQEASGTGARSERHCNRHRRPCRTGVVREAQRHLSLPGGRARLSAAEATTRLVGLTGLSSSTTAPGLFQGNESLLVNTLVTGSTGALTNPVFFNVGAGVTSLSGAAAWEIGTATGFDPRLVGVDIDIVDAANVLVASDTIQGTSSGFATSTLAGAIGPGHTGWS